MYNLKMVYRRKLFLDSVGVVFAFAFLFLAEYLLYTMQGFNFFTLLRSGSSIPLLVFISGAILGMASEYIGQFSINWWYYPSININKSLLLILPIFWGIFMLIMQDMYAIARTFGFHLIPAVLISTFITGCLIEGINLYTKTWVYKGRGSHPLILAFGWLVLLSFFFVIGFNAFIINPFGF